MFNDNAYNMENASILSGSDQSDSEDDIDNYGDPIFELEDDVLALLLPGHNPFFGHTLELVVKDGLNNADIFQRLIRWYLQLYHMYASQLSPQIY